MRYLKMPKCPENEIHIYSDAECERIVKAARYVTARSNGQRRPRWDLLIIVALSTGLRRGELLNCTWQDIDFAEQTIRVSPKANTAATWEWSIKDTDRRTLPLTDRLTQLLIDHQNRQPEGHPYAFVPPARYDYIQHELRARGYWTYSDSRSNVIPSFSYGFRKILRQAHVDEGQFHDLRRTAICNWFREGLRELEIMRLAGHANFATTHRYYLRVRDDLVDRAREATARGLCQNLLQNCCSSDFRSLDKKGCVT
ncbi:MAG: tyrosine-type recombinase/integrase [Planctomycetota bacterium]